VSVRPARAALLALVALTLPSVALAAPDEPVSAGSSTTAGAVPGRVIVVWKPGATREERLAARDDADSGFIGTLGDPQFQLLRPQQGQRVADAIAALRDDPNVQIATRDTYDVPHATTNDPLFNQLWGLQNVGANIDGFGGAIPGADVGALAAWDRTRGTPSTVVADLDSGYRFDAPDLGPVAWSNPAEPQNGADDDGNGIVDDSHGADFVGSDDGRPATDGDPTDDDVFDGGHGVHTAGTIGAAGNNGIGISGVAQDVRIMPLRVCHPGCPSSSQILAINYAGAHGARAANMSLGGSTSNPAIQAALAANPQVLFVISAGNGEDPVRRDGIGDDNDVISTYPCSYPLDNIVCVAALDQADQLASFSNFGAASVDVGAPGTEILSTFPVTNTLFTDDFETNDIGAKWTMAFSGFARAAAGDGPLTSFGMTDSPGAPPGSLSLHRATLTTGVAVPAGSGACTLSGRRFLALGGDGHFEYQLIPSVGSPAGFRVTRSTPGSSMATFSTVPVSGLAGTTVTVRFEYTAATSPTASDGVWLDDLKLTCAAPLSTPPTYGFLDGTSMAAPHVTGTAALLFSLNPAASVAQVRSALLATVHPVAALAGRTTTGGRIDAAAALDEIRQPDTSIASAPSRTARSSRAVFTFARSDAPIDGGFECQLDGGAFAACATPAAYKVRGGRHTFAVRALSPRAIVVDPSPATATWTLVQCKVPRLKGKSLRRAKRALRAAHCKLGRVKKPRGLRSAGRLVVTKSKPKARALRADGTRVRLTLARPALRQRRHGRRRRR